LSCLTNKNKDDFAKLDVFAIIGIWGNAGISPSVKTKNAYLQGSKCLKNKLKYTQ